MHVVCKILVLMLSDVVRLKICKYTNIKGKARYSVKHESLWWHFHNNCIKAFVHHLLKQLLNSVWLRCGICWRNSPVTTYRLYCTDKSCLYAGWLKNRLYHICGSGLTLCTCNTDSLYLLGRIIKISCWHTRKCKPCIIYLNICHPFDRSHIFFDNHCRCTFLYHIRDKIMCIWHSSRYAHKYRCLLHLARVIHECGNLYIYASC